MSDLALVLRRFDYGETSQTARLFSKKHGRLNVLAKGIKRPNANLRGPLDLFALAEIDLRLRPKSDLHLLVRYRVVSGFAGVRKNLERLYGAFYVTEVLREGTRDRDPSVPLFDATTATLAALETAAGKQAALAVAWFELAYLEVGGFAPRWDACATCGRVAPAGAPVRFAPWLTGLVCKNCLAERPLRIVTLTPGVRATLTALRAVSGPEEALSVEVADRDRRLLRRLLSDLMQGVMERELKAAAFLEGEGVERGAKARSEAVGDDGGA